MQDWADRWLLGDGGLTATTTGDSADAARMAALAGSVVPRVVLPGADGVPRDVVPADARATVLFTYPATSRPTPLPDGWNDIPGAPGCTLENRLFRDRWPEFAAAGVAVHGVSTQRPDEQARFAATEKVPYPLLSDVDLALVAALRLPTFRATQQLRLKRLILMVDPARVVRHVRYPVLDIPAAVSEALDLAKAVTFRWPTGP
jgi:peroxiredoxin